MTIAPDYLTEAEAALDGVIAEFRPILLEASGAIAHETKSNNTPVTELDLAVEKKIREALLAVDPNVGLWGEEHGREGNEDTFWLIDPIDGTEQFIRGIPAYRMMATLIVDHVPTYAYVFDIAKNEKYTATRDQGAFCNGQRLQISERPLARSWIEFSGDLARPDVVTLIPAIRQATRGIRITGDFTHTPQGRMEGQLYYKGNGSLWDWVPWAVINREVGAIVANIGQDEYDYRDGNFLAASPVIFDELKAIIEKAIADYEKDHS